jgi:mannose-6-phosphate isomerase-like protein (cupin superfamily)
MLTRWHNFQEGTKVPVQYPPQLFDVASVEAHFINPGDTVKLAMLRGPDEVHDVSVFLEIWQPGGSQRPNSHSKSVETFVFLRGTGRAYCDEFELDVRAGQLLVLPAGSLHRIESSTQGKLYAITTMAPDDGFAALVNRGETAPLDDEERAVLAQAPDDGSGPEPGSASLATSS